MNNQNVESINEQNKKNSSYSGFDIVGKRKILFIISACIIVFGVILFIIRGFNWDIDFTGGTVLQYSMHRTLDVAEEDKIDGIVKNIIGDNFAYSTIAGSAKDEIIIKSKAIETDMRNAVFSALSEEYGLDEKDILRADNVDPTVGKTLIKNTLLAVLLAVALMLVYITIRFDFLSGAAAVLCLTHDIFIMLIFYSLLQIPMGTSVIAAVLTILGYSINATIIIFDRVRENTKMNKEKLSFAGVVNKSISQTIMRSINTSVTTLLTVLMIYILGVSSIRDFVFPLIIGIVAGGYSSICLAGSFWTTFRREKKSVAEKAS